MKIFILHPGKASYPEIAAYKNFFSHKYVVQDGSIADYEKIPDKKDIVLWCIMGFYPTKLLAKYIIHDYRSLSVGRLAKLKDRIKKILSPTPNLRVFQNESIQKAMAFEDNVPNVFLPMGVPGWLLEMERNSTSFTEKYCYIGVISKERKIDTVIEAFLKNTPSEEKFILVGPTDKKILYRFGKESRLIFTGAVSQVEATTIANQCEYAICKVPDIYPYSCQMPTKFLEYATLGKTIICNDSPSNRRAHSTINSKAIFCGENIFDDVNLLTAPVSVNDSGISRYELDWMNVISNSGISSYLPGISPAPTKKH